MIPMKRKNPAQTNKIAGDFPNVKYAFWGKVALILLLTILRLNWLNAAAVKLTWQLNPENDVEYYCVYKDTVSNPSKEVAKVPATDSTFIDPDIAFGDRYFYRITAVDTAENESEFSNEITIFIGNPTPVELSTFSAQVQNSQIFLEWLTLTESNNFGFEIQKSDDGINFVKIGFVPGFGTSTATHLYKYTDEENLHEKYYYRLKQIDSNGNFEYSEVVIVDTRIPEKFQLSQNYPNPFNPDTKIEYSITENSDVQLIIVDLLGREITKLVDSQQNAGYHTVKWEGKDSNGMKVSSGNYFCIMQTRDYQQVIKVTLAK